MSKARVQIPSPSPKSNRKQKEELDSGLSLKSHGPPSPTTLQLSSMKEASNKQTQRVKVTQYDPLYLLSTKTGGQQEEEHRRVQHVQGKHYQRNILQSL